MRTVAVSLMTTNLRHLLGVDALTTAESSAAVRSFNKYSRLARERTDWPDVTELKQFIPDVRVRAVNVGNGGTGYSSASVSFSGGGGSGAAATATIDSDGAVNGVAITNQGTGYTSAPTVTISGGGGSGATAEATVLGFIDHGTSVGEVLRITENDPYSAAVPQEVPFRSIYESGSDYGLTLLENRSSTAPVWVKYRLPIADYTSSSTNYPYVFSEYAIMGAYADWLLADGQMEKANVASQRAENFMLNELDKLERQQRQFTFTQFTTYGTSAAQP